MLKKTLILMVVIVMLTSFTSTTMATSGGGGDTDYTYISSTITNLEIDSVGHAYCSANIYCYSGTDSVRISAYLQKNVNGSWTTVEHWAKNVTGDRGSLNEDLYVTSGYQYRLYVYYYAYEGNESESTTGVDYYTYN